MLHVFLLHAPNFVPDSRNLILERLKLQNVTTYIYTQIARDQNLECSRATECSRTVVHDCGIQNTIMIAYHQHFVQSELELSRDSHWFLRENTLLIVF